MNKHTPGPWTYAKTGTWPDTNHDLGIYSNEGTGHVAKIEGWGNEATANARLISAAPDMYEALLLCVAVLENGADDLGAKSAAIAALSKAQGGENE